MVDEVHPCWLTGLAACQSPDHHDVEQDELAALALPEAVTVAVPEVVTAAVVLTVEAAQALVALLPEVTAPQLEVLTQE